MTEEEPVFDPCLKKKKKKKKTPFDLDAAAAVENTANVVPPPPAEEDALGGGALAGGGGGLEEDVDLDSFGKKKKKKKKVTLLDEDAAADATAAAAAAPGSDDDNVADDYIDLDNFGKKKKKKKSKEATLNLEDLDEALPENYEDEDLDLESFGKKKKKKKKLVGVDLNAFDDKENQENEVENPWVDSDRDYSYDELLSRVFVIMKDKNPEVVAGEKKKFVMRPPQVVRVGTKKTAFVNFTEIAKMLHRQPKHLSDFLSAELGTVGAVDGNNQLIMKGRFQQKHIENVLRRYIKEYVTCHTCRSPDTILNKEARLFFLQCMTCHSRCSVQTIKTGFQAVTGKRSAIRAKQ